MGLFQNFPYTNFHEINLDQIIKIMRDMQDEWESTKNDWNSLQEFINNYFDNLDVSEEVLQALQTMAGNGELGTIIDPVIVNQTSTWLASHITPTTPAVDNTLSIAGAAADAKATGDAVDDLKEDFGNFTSYVLENPELLYSASWVENSAISATGAISTNNNFHYVENINVHEGEYILVYISNGANNNTRIHGYDNNGNWLRQIESSASGTVTTPIIVPFSVINGTATIKISVNKAVKLMVLAEKKPNTNTIKKLSNDIRYALNTNTEILFGYDFTPSDIYEDGYLYFTRNAIGKTISEIQRTSNGNVKIYKINVSNYKKVYFPCIKSTQLQGELFENTDGVINAVYANSVLDSGTIVDFDIPDGTQYMYLTVNKAWNLSNMLLLGVISTIESGGGSGTIIVHDDSYPSLTDTEKNQIVTLCNDYFNKRTIFNYGGTRFRNQYANTDCIVNNKFVMNCGMFAQFIWMGRNANDFNLNAYTSQINKSFNWGYYFDFAIHKAIFGLAKSNTGTDVQKYYGYQTPTGSEPFAFNAYTESGSMIWRYFMAAADLAEELYNMGCEVPRRSAEVGDLVFYRDPEYSGMTLETQLNFRNISHVGVITDIDYLGSGRMRTTECTFWSDQGTIAHMSIKESDNSDKTRAGFYENRIVMIARHPHAFGIPSNVPEFITTI